MLKSKSIIDRICYKLKVCLKVMIAIRDLEARNNLLIILKVVNNFLLEIKYN